MKAYGVLLFFTILLTLSCNKDDDDCCDPTNPACSNYDPCYGVQEVSADFRILEIIGSNGSSETMMMETDTVFTLNLVRFEPKQEQYDSVTWLIGSETLHEHSLSRKNFPVYKTVPITLIVYRKPSTGCFPGDDGRDTVTKMITGMPIDDLPINGAYQGTNSDVQDDLFIIMVNDTIDCQTQLGQNLLKNIPKDVPREGPYKCSLPFPPFYGGKGFYIPPSNHTDDSYFLHGANYCGMSIKAELKDGRLRAVYEYDKVALKNAIEGKREHGIPVYVIKNFNGKKL
jgi:hypothetical protein